MDARLTSARDSLFKLSQTRDFKSCFSFLPCWFCISALRGFQAFFYSRDPDSGVFLFYHLHVRFPGGGKCM